MMAPSKTATKRAIKALPAEELAAIPMTILGSNRQAVMNPAYRAAFGQRGKRTPDQQANFDAVQEYNRSRIGVGPGWNS